MTQVIGTSPLRQLTTPTYGFSVVARRTRGRKSNGAGKLNLVSLMDIFTILVFFLMLNSGDVEVLQPDEAIALPSSTAKLKPSDVPVIKISNTDIRFGDSFVVALNELGEGNSIIELEQVLQRYAADEKLKSAPNILDDEQAEAPQGVSIMSDESVNYTLLKRVLYASAQAGFRDIGLATEYRQSQLSSFGVSSSSVSGSADTSYSN